MPDEKFKLPGSSYEELVKIIRTYGQISQPESLAEISKRSAMNASIISRNAGFLIAMGILESGAKKLPTSSGKDLAHALEYNMTDQITACWQKVVGGNDFFEKLLTSIRIRKGMDEETLEAHIAYSAGQPKKKQFMTGARTIIDILRAAGLIVESDGKITASSEVPHIGPRQKEQESDRMKDEAAKVTAPSGVVTSPSVGVGISIRVNINCTPSELENLSDKLKAFIKEFSQEGGSEDEGV